MLRAKGYLNIALGKGLRQEDKKRVKMLR